MHVFDVSASASGLSTACLDAIRSATTTTTITSGKRREGISSLSVGLTASWSLMGFLQLSLFWAQ